MRAIKRPPIDPHWRKRAECQYYEPEYWSVGGEGEEDHPFAARPICALDCTVREFCLRTALREGDNYGVMRGGIEFLGKPMVHCRRCRYPVATPTKGVKTSICAVCREYDPCLGRCGRMVAKDGDSWFCTECKTKEVAVGRSS